MKGKLFTRANFVPGSLNSDSRTVDVVFATPTPVKRYSWNIEEYYNEVLDMNGANLERAVRGLPVLDNHNAYSSVSAIIGRAENVRREGDQWVSTVRFSKRDEIQSLISDIEAGIVSDISFGYIVDEVERQNKRDGEKYSTINVRKWTPTEISFVTIPADPKAGTRSANDFDLELMPKENSNLNDKQYMKKEGMLAFLKKRNISVADDATDEAVRVEFERALETYNGVDAEALRNEAVATERTRIAAITAAGRKAGVESNVIDDMVKRGLSIDSARAEIIEKWIDADPNKGTAANPSVGHDEKDKFRAVMSDALTLRANPGEESKMKAENIASAREFRGMSLLRMAEEILTHNGVKTRGMSNREIAQTALGLDTQFRGQMASSDFPILLGDTFNRTLRAAYELNERTFMPFCRRVNLADFREISRAQISGLMDSFDEIAEGGEYRNSSMDEAKETYKLAKYGKKVAITWEAIINDDLSAFTRIPAAFAAKAAQKQSDLVYGILTGNPIMGDSVALFNSAHGNYVTSSGTLLSETNLDIAFQAFRAQQSIEGDYLNLSPKFLIVGPKNELKAYKLTSTNFVPATQSNVSSPSFTGMQVIVDPRITDYAWFLAAAPSMIDTIEYAFLDGEPELFTEQRVGFDIDGYEIKARMVFAAKAIDYRGLFKNDGAAS